MLEFFKKLQTIPTKRILQFLFTLFLLLLMLFFSLFETEPGLSLHIKLPYLFFTLVFIVLLANGILKISDNLLMVLPVIIVIILVSYSFYIKQYEWGLGILGLLIALVSTPFFTKRVELEKHKQQFFLEHRYKIFQEYYESILSIYNPIMSIDGYFRGIVQNKFCNVDKYQEIKTLYLNAREKLSIQKPKLFAEADLLVPLDLGVLASMYGVQADICLDVINGQLHNLANKDMKQFISNYNKHQNDFEKLFAYKREIQEVTTEILEFDVNLKAVARLKRHIKKISLDNNKESCINQA